MDCLGIFFAKKCEKYRNKNDYVRSLSILETLRAINSEKTSGVNQPGRLKPMIRSAKVNGDGK